jgi:mono/diheme cytochrome c family protein
MTIRTFALPYSARLVPVTALTACLFIAACDNAVGSPVREWTPADHTNQGNPSSGQIDTKQKRAGMDKLEAQGVNDVVFAAWKANCVTCHGMTGKGDGPQGPMMRPPDMTSPAWQRTRIESEMAHAIKNGRGRMPAFGHLPEKTIEGLVKLVRMLNPEFRGSGEAVPDSAPPSGETAPPSPEPRAPQPSPTEAAPTSP